MNTSAPLSSLSQGDQHLVADRLFQKLALLFGAGKTATMYAGSNLDEAKAVWLESLQPFSVDQIKRALDHLTSSGAEFFPSLPTFVGLCRQFRDVGNYAKLPPPRPLPADRSPEIAAKIADFLARGGRGESRRNPKDWALRIMADPKSFPHYSVECAKEALGILPEPTNGN